MKSTCIESEVGKEIKFPCLMLHLGKLKQGGNQDWKDSILMFTTPQTFIVVYSGNPHEISIGTMDYCGDINQPWFEPFNGKVILEN